MPGISHSLEINLSSSLKVWEVWSSLNGVEVWRVAMVTDCKQKGIYTRAWKSQVPSSPDRGRPVPILGIAPRLLSLICALCVIHGLIMGKSVNVLVVSPKYCVYCNIGSVGFTDIQIYGIFKPSKVSMNYSFSNYVFTQEICPRHIQIYGLYKHFSFTVVPIMDVHMCVVWYVSCNRPISL